MQMGNWLIPHWHLSTFRLPNIMIKCSPAFHHCVSSHPVWHKIITWDGHFFVSVTPILKEISKGNYSVLERTNELKEAPLLFYRIWHRLSMAVSRNIKITAKLAWKVEWHPCIFWLSQYFWWNIFTSCFCDYYQFLVSRLRQDNRTSCQTCHFQSYFYRPPNV